MTDTAHSLAAWLEWLNLTDCPCPYQWKGMGTLHGVSMGDGWLRQNTDPRCRHHGAPATGP